MKAYTDEKRFCSACLEEASEMTPDTLTREQMKALLEWPAPDPCVTDDMLRVAILNRINLGRLSWEQLEQKAA